MEKISVYPPRSKICPVDHYVYTHQRADKGSVFYVGKGQGSRAWHISRRSNKHWHSTAKKHGVIVKIIKDGMTECCALTLEKIIISRIGLANLCNLTLGGEGSTGYRPCAMVREKMSKAKKGIPRGPLSDETRQKISLSHMGIRPSAEALQKMSQSKIGQRKREGNNKFKPEIQVFHHPDYGVFEGTQYDLRHKYGIGAPCVRAIITKRQKTAKGWSYIGEKK